MYCAVDHIQIAIYVGIPIPMLSSNQNICGRFFLIYVHTGELHFSPWMDSHTNNTLQICTTAMLQIYSGCYSQVDVYQSLGMLCHTEMPLVTWNTRLEAWTALDNFPDVYYVFFLHFWWHRWSREQPNLRMEMTYCRTCLAIFCSYTNCLPTIPPLLPMVMYLCYKCHHEKRHTYIDT